MSKAIHMLLESEASHRIPGVEGNFPFDVAVLEGSIVIFLFPDLMLSLLSDSPPRRHTTPFCGAIWQFSMDYYRTRFGDSS